MGQRQALDALEDLLRAQQQGVALGILDLLAVGRDQLVDEVQEIGQLALDQVERGPEAVLLQARGGVQLGLADGGGRAVQDVFHGSPKTRVAPITHQGRTPPQ